jgi:hypothetical protein
LPWFFFKKRTICLSPFFKLLKDCPIILKIANVPTQPFV